MAEQLMEKVQSRPGKAPLAPKSEAAAPAQAPAPAAAAVPEHVVLAEMEHLRAENARLRAQLAAPTGAANLGTPAFGTRSATPQAAIRLPEPAPAAAGEADARLAIGEPGEGKKLFLVSLPGHKSRVVCPERQVPLYLAKLPVWATNQGEAWMLFETWNGICFTTQQPQFELVS